MVIPDVGLVIAFYDFIEIGDSVIYPGDGGAHTPVTCRLVVFRPFIGELLTGEVLLCTNDGVRVTLGFYEDIFIPKQYCIYIYIIIILVPIPSFYNPADRMWIWTYSENEVDQQCPLKSGDKINFKIKTIKFTTLDETIKGTTATTVDMIKPDLELDSLNNNPPSSSAAISASDSAPIPRTRSSSIDIQANSLDRIRSFDLNEVNTIVPEALSITGTIEEDGLGAQQWWC